MPLYQIGEREFPNKDLIKKRCREIIAETKNGDLIEGDELIFLLELFQTHDEWNDKSAKGVKGITIQTIAEYGTRGFILILSDDTTIDISFHHAIKLLRGEKTRPLQSQKLVDYKNAARTTINEDIRLFRDQQLALQIVCPFSGDLIIRENCAVDHEPPQTFDKLLHDFTLDKNINPLEVKVGSKNGTVAIFEDLELTKDWLNFHRENCRLRLLSTIGHAQVSSPRIDWNDLMGDKKSF